MITKKGRRYQSVCYEVKVVFDNLRIWYEFIIPRNGIIEGEGFPNRLPTREEWSDADWGARPFREAKRLDEISAYFTDTGRSFAGEASNIAQMRTTTRPSRREAFQTSGTRSMREITCEARDLDESSTSHASSPPLAPIQLPTERTGRCVVPHSTRSLRWQKMTRGQPENTEGSSKRVSSRRRTSCMRCYRGHHRCDGGGAGNPCDTCIKAGKECQWPNMDSPDILAPSM